MSSDQQMDPIDYVYEQEKHKLSEQETAYIQKCVDKAPFIKHSVVYKKCKAHDFNQKIIDDFIQTSLHRKIDDQEDTTPFISIRNKKQKKVKDNDRPDSYYKRRGRDFSREDNDGPRRKNTEKSFRYQENNDRKFNRYQKNSKKYEKSKDRFEKNSDRYEGSERYYQHSERSKDFRREDRQRTERANRRKDKYVQKDQGKKQTKYKQKTNNGSYENQKARFIYKEKDSVSDKQVELTQSQIGTQKERELKEKRDKELRDKQKRERQQRERQHKERQQRERQHKERQQRERQQIERERQARERRDNNQRVAKQNQVHKEKQRLRQVQRQSQKVQRPKASQTPVGYFPVPEQALNFQRMGLQVMVQYRLKPNNQISDIAVFPLSMKVQVDKPTYYSPL